MQREHNFDRQTEHCPLVSIIVPIFNAESRLERCIESLASQTYTNIEIILVDDGSGDNSPLICEK